MITFAELIREMNIMKPIFIAGPCVIESAELLDTVAA